MFKIHSAEKHANSNEQVEHEPRNSETSCPVFLFFRQHLWPGPSPDDWATAPVRESTWKRERPLGAVQMHGHIMQRRSTPKGILFSVFIKERFQTVPFQQGVLKWTFIKIRQKQQNTKSGNKVHLKNAIILYKIYVSTKLHISRKVKVL